MTSSVARDKGEDKEVLQEHDSELSDDTPLTSVQQRAVLCVQLNIFLYSTCFWIQQSCFPYLTKKLGVDNVVYGYLQTAFALAQLAGGPLFGRFGDLFGARYAMVIAYSSGILTYGTLYLATDVKMLFVSRAMSLFLACMQGSQMVITDLTPYKQRSDALGKLGLIYGLGMVAGPFVGGQITRNYSEEAAALVAAIGSLISVISVFVFIPTNLKHVNPDDKNVANVFNMKVIIRLLTQRYAAFLMTVKCLVGLPIGVLQSMFSRVAMDAFKLEANYNGMVMSYIGVVTMLVQGFGVGYLTKKFPDDKLMKFSALSATFAYIAMSQVTDISQFLVAILPLIIGMTLMQIVISAALTKAVPQQDTGTMIGLSMATNSLIRTASPTIGGYMITSWGFPSIGYFGLVVCGSVSAVLFGTAIAKESKDEARTKQE